jgi:AraC-like DNA-binding protein
MNGGRVGEVAASVGYVNKSQFARDYKDYFGESPTATLRGMR